MSLLTQAPGSDGEIRFGMLRRCVSTRGGWKKIRLKQIVSVDSMRYFLSWPKRRAAPHLCRALYVAASPTQSATTCAPRWRGQIADRPGLRLRFVAALIWYWYSAATSARARAGRRARMVTLPLDWLRGMVLFSVAISLRLMPIMQRAAID
jgi:hypothetical protein